MLELLALSGGTALVFATVVDFIDDRGIPGLVRSLAWRLGRNVELTDSRETPKLNAWLRENAGTANLSDADKAFFKEQLRLAYRDTGGESR